MAEDTSTLKEFAKGVGRVFLPKPAEEILGLSAPERTLEDESFTNRTRALQQRAVATYESNPAAYRNRIKQLVVDEVQSGTTDPTAIRAAVRRNIRNDINTMILQRLNPPEKSLGGFARNFKRNAGEVVNGIGVMLGLPVELGYKMVTKPVGTTTQGFENVKSYITSPGYREQVYEKYLEPVVDEYKEYRNPWQKFYEDPLDVFLDVTAILGLSAKATTTAGNIAAKNTSRVGNIKPATLSKARETLRNSNDPVALRQAAATVAEARSAKVAGDITKPSRFATQTKRVGEALRKASTPLSLKNLSGGTKWVLSKTPGGEEWVRNIARAASVRTTLTKSQQSFLNARNTALNKVDEVVRNLTDEEIKAIPPALEGFTRLPDNARPEVHQAVALFRSLAKDGERLGKRTGALSEDSILNRRYLPIANWLEKEQGFNFTDATRTNREALQTVTQNATASLERATQRLADGKITQKQFNKIRNNINEKVRKAEAKFEDLLIEEGFKSLSGDELRAQIAVIKRQFPDIDPVYMRHFFADKPRNFGEFFLNTKPVRSYKPGSFKRTYNRDGYIGQSTDITRDQFREILERQTVENLKFESNIELIKGLINDPETKPLRPGDELLPDHVAFAPDGMIRFYRGTIDLASELQRRLEGQGGGDDMWDLFFRSVDETFSQKGIELTKNYVGVTKAKLYQVPKAKAAELQKNVTTTNPYIKVFYDKPLDAFRFAALAFYPRYHFNNIIGNAVFSIVSGDVFNPKAFYISHQARKQPGLLPDDLFGGVHAVERTTSGKMGGAVDRIPWLKHTIELHDHFLDSGKVGGVVRNLEEGASKYVLKPLVAAGNKSFQVGQYVDDLFKGAAYVNRALKEERKGMITRMTTSVDDTLKLLERNKLNTKQRERIIQDVHDWYYYGLNLMDFERRIVRRVLPFYTWLRWATLYSYRITTEAPVRANIISNMAQDFYMFTGQDQLPEEWLKGSVPIGTGENGEVYYLRTAGMNPFSHLNDFFNEGGMTTAFKAAAPLPKTFYEQATGRDVFLGERFTKKGLTEAFGGDLYVFDPELGRTRKVSETVKPSFLENMLRNFIPQYILLETALAKGNRRYTAEGLDEILKDLFRDEGERKAIIEDIITKQPSEQTSAAREFGKALGINIYVERPDQRVARREALERANKAILNQQLPIMNENFNKLLKVRIREELMNGTPREEIADEVKVWIGYNIEELQKLR